MTDKQIIIDGVNVKDCKRRIGKDNYCRYYKRLCSENNYNCIWKKYYRKEQECEELEGRLKYIINENKVLKDCATDEHIDIVALKNYISTLEYHNDQLKAEVKSKTEYIQEQREIIDQYSKEIEMYKKCQGKRASKREEELKAENEELIRRITKIFACLIKANRTNKIVDTLWVDNITTLWDYIAQTLGIEGDQVHIEEQILQKISECGVEND